MTDPLEVHRDADMNPPGEADDSPQREPWHRPVLTRIPLSRTLSAIGSNTDGHTGSIP